MQRVRLTYSLSPINRAVPRLGLGLGLATGFGSENLFTTKAREALGRKEPLPRPSPATHGGLNAGAVGQRPTLFRLTEKLKPLDTWRADFQSAVLESAKIFRGMPMRLARRPALQFRGAETTEPIDTSTAACQRGWPEANLVSSDRETRAPRHLEGGLPVRRVGVSKNL